MTIDIELWKFILLQGGLAVVAGVSFLYARAERKERIALSTRLIDMSADGIKSNMTVAGALSKLEESVDKLADAINRRIP